MQVVSSFIAQCYDEIRVESILIRLKNNFDIHQNFVICTHISKKREVYLVMYSFPMGGFNRTCYTEVVDVVSMQFSHYSEQHGALITVNMEVFIALATAIYLH